jgi:DNA-binding response OmpR family regulator
MNDSLTLSAFCSGLRQRCPSCATYRFDVSTNLLDVTMARLYTKIDTARLHRIIRTVRGSGYLLI